MMEDRVQEIIFVTSVGVTTPVGECSIVLVDTVAIGQEGRGCMVVGGVGIQAA